MVQLRLIPVFEDPEFVNAATEYEKIWQADGEQILNALEKHSQLPLNENRIAVVVYEGVSYSGRDVHDVMKLRASYSEDIKKGTLIHELSHRLMFQMDAQSTSDTRDIHEILFLFLYDVWAEVYGSEFANKKVAHERSLSARYEDAWSKTLKLDTTERKQHWALYLKNHQ